MAYRLAPSTGLSILWKDPDLRASRTRFPAALHDVVDVAVSLMDHAGSAIDLGGASAGANLAAAAALTLRDEQRPIIRSLVLAYGIFHAELPDDPSVEADLRGALTKWAFGPAMVRRMNVNYVGSAAELRPGRAFPGGTDVAGLPPTLVLDARNDRLRKSGHAFASELRNAGVVVEEAVIDGPHAFLNAPGTVAFDRGIDCMRSWLELRDRSDVG